MPLELRQVGKSFASTKVLHNVSLDIGEGAFHTLLGPSGCGKTTILRLIAGFEAVSHGEIRLDGRSIAAAPPQARPINTVFQNYALFPHMTAFQNVAFGLRSLRRGRQETERRTREMLALVRLQEYASRYPSQLSGGQQQRVALARALAPAPKVLLLDEPLSALDFQLRKGMQAELKRVHAETGVTFVLVTHDREEALALSTSISVLDAGQIVQTGSPDSIYRRPSSAFVARFVGGSNIIGSEVSGLSWTVAVRPEQTLLVGPGDGFFDASVINCDFVGDAYQITLRSHFGIELNARIVADVAPDSGTTFGVSWQPGDAVQVLA